MISVIVPVYNVENYIKHCVESVLAQTNPDFELLLINDGSKDNCGRICDELAGRDERIRVFHKENGGVSSARNMGLDNSRGDYIFFLDADDWIEPDLFADCMEELERNHATVFMFEYFIDQAGNRVKHSVADRYYGLIDKTALIINSITPRNRFVWSKIVRRELLEDCRFNTDIILGEDTLYHTQAFVKADEIPTVYTKKAYYHYVQSESSAVRSPFHEKKLSGLTAYELQLQCCQEGGMNQVVPYAAEAYTELAITLARKAIEDVNFDEKSSLKMIKKGIRNYAHLMLHSPVVAKKSKFKAGIACVSLRLTCMLCKLWG